MGIFGNFFNARPQSEEEAKKSSQVMENLKKYRGEETGKWLNMMQRDQSFIPKPSAKPTVEDVDRRETLDDAPYTPPVSAQYTTASYRVEELTGKAASTLPQSEMLTWVNKLFSDFAVQASSFNSSAQGTHLVVTVHAPEFDWQEAKLDEYTPEKKMAGFRGHLATVQWGMLIQGAGNKIDIFIVPAEEILMFTMHGMKKSDFAPFMTIDTSEIETKKVWHIGGSAVTFDTISLLVRELLGDLVRVSTGSMNESELFAEHKDGLKLGHTVAQGYIAPVPAAGSGGNAKGSQPLQSSIERMSAWAAADELLSAIDADMPWLTQLKSDTDAASNASDSEHLEDLITRLRSISGQVGALKADYRPVAGSKYNPS